MEDLQTELQASSNDTAFVGVNELGQEFQNGLIPAISDIPWLQDGDKDGDGRSDLWEEWVVTYRDVYVLDEKGELSSVYNLTVNDLGESSAYNALKELIQDAASSADPAPASSWWPEGWVYLDGAYLYDFEGASWYYLDESSTSSAWQVDLATGQWADLSELSGWHYFDTSPGYFYSFGEGSWHFFSGENLQWILNLSSGQWVPLSPSS